jgi:hypothetical protein
VHDQAAGDGCEREMTRVCGSRVGPAAYKIKTSVMRAGRVLFRGRTAPCKRL